MIKILIVDDETDTEFLIRQKFRHAIRNGDFFFFFSSSGEQALSLMEKESDISIVITDLQMPKMDGITLLKRLREINSFLKFIIISGYDDKQNLPAFIQDYIFSYLSKPIDFEYLFQVLKKASHPDFS